MTAKEWLAANPQGSCYLACEKAYNAGVKAGMGRSAEIAEDEGENHVADAIRKEIESQKNAGT